MVILNRSLRAVFRKESWMFCAGLPLSIADLLRLCLATNQLAPSAESGQAQTNSMFLADFPPKGTRGDNPACSPPHFFQDMRRLAGSCEYDTVSPRAFQPGTCGSPTFSLTA